MICKTLSQLTLAAGLAIALTVPAMAQGINAGANGAMTDGDIPIKGMPRNLAAKFRAMDTNHDGMVSKMEFLTYAEKMFDKMDPDGKGLMTPKQYMMFAKTMSWDVVGKTHE